MLQNKSSVTSVIYNVWQGRNTYYINYEDHLATFYVHIQTAMLNVKLKLLDVWVKMPDFTDVTKMSKTIFLQKYNK